MNELTTIALRRLGVLAVDPVAPTTPEVAVAYLAALARLGVRVTNPESINDSVVASWPTVEAAVTELRGGGDPIAPLFDGFPDRLPAFDAAGLRFLLAAVRLVDIDDPTDDDVRTALDFSSVAWWPASSVPQDVDAARIAKTRQSLLAGDTRTEWIDVRIATDDDTVDLLRAFTEDCAYSASSLRPEVLADMVAVLDRVGADHIDLDQVRFTETRAALVARLFATAAADPASAASFAAAGLTPDDLLRLFAALTDTDVSLASPIKFPALTRPQRRLVLAALDATPRLRDVFRRRGLWLAAAKSLHVGEHAAKFPAAAAVFAELRATRYDRTSTAARFEHAIAVGEVDTAVPIAVAEAPAMLLRNLRRVAYRARAHAPSRIAVLEGVAAAAAIAPLRVVLAVRAQIADNGATYPRLAITKSGAPLIIDNAQGHLALPEPFAAELLDVLDSAAAAKCAALSSWNGERVWIDSALETLTVSDQQRSTTDALVELDRGSRLAFGDAKVLRLFVHWREPEDATSDLDLSLIALGPNFEQLDQVSWTNLAQGAMTHSGDLTSAPHGAAEFIDIRLDSLDPSWRYLAPVIYRYSGPSFAELPEAVTGWMARDKCSAAQSTFDIKTVQNACALTGSRGTALPFVYDIEHRTIVYLDVYVPSLYHASTETSGDLVAEMAQAVSTRHRIRPTVKELAQLHTTARGATFTDDPADATITFSTTDGATFNALRPQRILAELL